LEHLGHPHQQIVDVAADIASSRADGDAQRHRRHGGGQRDQQADASPVDDGGEHVATEVVGSEWMRPRRREQHVVRGRERVARSEHVGAQGHCADDADQRQPGAGARPSTGPAHRTVMAGHDSSRGSATT
jgi:hypothetical protein